MVSTILWIQSVPTLKELPVGDALEIDQLKPRHTDASVAKDSEIHVLDTLARQQQWSCTLICSWLFHDMKTLFRITGIWWEESTTH